jgi:hypothetical protein
VRLALCSFPATRCLIKSWYLGGIIRLGLFWKLHHFVGTASFRLVHVVFAMALGNGNRQTRTALFHNSNDILHRQTVDTTTTTSFLGAYEPIGTLPR